MSQSLPSTAGAGVGVGGGDRKPLGLEVGLARETPSQLRPDVVSRIVASSVDFDGHEQCLGLLHLLQRFFRVRLIPILFLDLDADVDDGIRKILAAVGIG